jgi:hypothetical protein
MSFKQGIAAMLTRAYPMVTVQDIESGKVKATRALFGAD